MGKKNHDVVNEMKNTVLLHFCEYGCFEVDVESCFFMIMVTNEGSGNKVEILGYPLLQLIFLKKICRR